MVATQVHADGKGPTRLRYIDDPSFRGAGAAALYGDGPITPHRAPDAAGHLGDDVTRDLAKRMHYAAFRLNGAGSGAAAQAWRNRYLHFRDQIILGNRKLIFRAVQMRVRDPQLFEDCAAECHLLLIRAVACYNPWLGIRFSTYAFTCLLRELTRLVQRKTKDRLRQAASFGDFLMDDLPAAETNATENAGPVSELGRYLTSDSALLSDREKEVLCQRFGFTAKGKPATLKDIGSELQISKERVRQLQNSGLDKLRVVLLADGVGA